MVVNLTTNLMKKPNGLKIIEKSRNNMIVLCLKELQTATNKQISKYGGLDKGNVSRGLTELINYGVVEKIPNNPVGDQRMQRYRLTKTGEGVAHLMSAFDFLSLDSRDEFGFIVRKIKEAWRRKRKKEMGIEPEEFEE